MSELVFVRHGQASFGQKSYDKLSELGIEQARILAQHWQAIGEEFDHIYAGSLLRQQETARELLPLVKNNVSAPETHEGLNEYSGDAIVKIHLRDQGEELQSDFEFGGTFANNEDEKRSFQSVFEEATDRWLNDELEPSETEPHFESWNEFKSRVFAAFDDIMARHSGGSRVLVATSGGVIALALQRVLQFPDEQVIRTNWMVHNSSVTRIRYGSGKISLTQFNSLPHLEKEGMQEFVTYR
ncbi:MAG: histidine phosphatase family protein [Gammaproteobacteria bacterium]|nr:histidine phosphatase family protein [Gammaproteobacteria bacterium]